MGQDVLTVAWKYMRRRNFATAIKLLEDKLEIYEGNFEYYLMLGIACLYVGDIGSAVTYLQQARRIKITDSRLLLGQAAIFLRRGDTERALQYYMEIIDMDPGNKVANNAMEFIRKKGDYDTICRWVDTGRIEQFYPPLGINPNKVASIVAPVLVAILCVVLLINLVGKKDYASGARLEIPELTLSAEEKDSPQEKDLSNQVFAYILSDKQITNSYNDALRFFQEHRDNAAQVEINRLVNSNASSAIKEKAQILKTHLEEPTFDSLTDNPTYAQVNGDTRLYLDCWVSWSGKISNAVQNDDGSYACQLLVGYETGTNVDGIVLVKFGSTPSIVPDQPVRILGKIQSEDDKVFMQGTAVYQSVKDGLKNN